MLISDLIALISTKIRHLFETSFSYFFNIMFYHDNVLHFIIQVIIFNDY
jgi:hypothetical protein